MSTELSRLPPHNLDAEQAVLGSLLLDRDVIAQVLEILSPVDFYREPHAIIFSAIADLLERGEPVDIVTVVDSLRNQGKLETVGGSAYIASLASVVPTASNALYYSRIVEQKSVLRRLIEAGTRIATLGYDTDTPLEELIDQSEKLVFTIAQRRLSMDFVEIKGLVTEVYARIDNLFHNKRLTTGVRTGFDTLDRLTAGFQSSDMVIVAARPSVGKTSFCLNVAENVALREKLPVAIFSLEMSKEQLVQRMICSHARVDAQKVRTGFLSNEDMERLSNTVPELYRAPIYIDDTPGISLLEIRVKARRLKMERGLGIVMVDYLQLMSNRTRAENRVQEISEMTRGLKNLARELQVPIIVISQLSREVEKREGKKPQLSDLRESGSIEQDADTVLMLFREDLYKQRESGEQTGATDIIIAKQRNGPTGIVKLKFIKEYTRFENLGAHGDTF
ncbi:MAG: replicative DNA helicase [Coprothermobacterota bacterium]|nr:replicative DNA helicase [Coprothermobacterota bacterium]